MRVFSASIALFCLHCSHALALQQSSDTTNDAPSIRVSQLSLKQALKLAEQGNPDIIAQRSNLDVGESNLDAAKAGWLPSLQVSAQRPHDTSVTGTISVRQPIYGFGKISAPINTSKSRLALLETELDGTINNILFDTANAYIDYWINEQRSEIANANIQALSELFELTKRLIKGQFASQADALLASARLNQSRVELTQLNTERAQLRLMLIQLIQRDFDSVSTPAIEAILSIANNIELSDILTNNTSVETSLSLYILRLKKTSMKLVVWMSLAWY